MVHQHVTSTHLVVASLAEISTDFHRKYMLTAGWSLPASICTSLIEIMNDTYFIISSGLSANQIDMLEIAPNSYYFFRTSIEGIIV